MPKSQKTLIAVILAVVLIIIAAIFILGNNKNRTDTKQNSESVSAIVSSNPQSQVTSVPLVPENNEPIQKIPTLPPTPTIGGQNPQSQNSSITNTVSTPTNLNSMSVSQNSANLIPNAPAQP